jgi:hypothetical protein
LRFTPVVIIPEMIIVMTMIPGKMNCR